MSIVALMNVDELAADFDVMLEETLKVGCLAGWLAGWFAG